MADDKNEKASVSDKKVAGPKTEDSKRTGEVDQNVNIEGANRDLEARRLSQHGDLTSSSGEQNNPGQHGRDGGEINEQSNNPAPSEDVVSGERADDSNTESGKELRKEEGKELKKL